MTNKLFQFITILLFLPFMVNAAEWDEQTYRQIEQSIAVPQINGRDYPITKFGAKPSAAS